MNKSIALSAGTVLFFLGLAAPLAAAERWSIGLTANDGPIEALVVPAAESSPTVLLIGGLQGPADPSVEVVRREVDAFEKQAQARRAFRLIAIPLANPDSVSLQFPPTGTAYRNNAESHVLWRWIGIHAPDLVVIAGSNDAALATAKHLATQPTKGLGLTKRAFNRSLGVNLDAQLDIEEELQREAGRSADYAEGVRAFLEKRPPKFTGE